MDPPDNIVVDEIVPILPVVPEGNTNTSGPNALYRWTFTLKSSYCDKDGIDVPIAPGELFTVLSEFCKEFVYQLERGEEGGYEHYQGCFSLKVKHRFSEVKNIVGFNSIHLEPARNWVAAKRYCSKEDTRVIGPWNQSSDVPSDQLVISLQLNWWQEIVDKELQTKPDDRSIFWIYDLVGNSGKSTYAKYCAIKYGAVVVNNGSFADLACCIPNSPKVVIFDFPRTIEGRVNYSAMEAIKNGLIFSGKYESKTKIFASPHVLVFANFEPDYSAMSRDRWKVITL